MLARAGVRARIVKRPGELAHLRGLVIPGGESTTLIRLIDIYGFWDPLYQFVRDDNPILATCAGLILLARKVLNPVQRSLGLIDITVERNGFGRQRESFEATGRFLGYKKPRNLEMVFIRAPRIIHHGPSVQPLGFWKDECVMVQEGRILAMSFHPELTDDLTVHKYFLAMV